MPDPKIFDEAPQDDRLEQETEVQAEQPEPTGPVPLEADEADATDQRREVAVDEEEYR